MTRKKPPASDAPAPSGRRGRALTPDEANLWAHVASSVEDRKRGKGRVRRGGSDQAGGLAESGSSERTRAASPAAALPAMPQSSPPPGGAKPSPPAPSTASPGRAAKAPELAEFDRRKVRHIARGKQEIDARLDLHGLRQSEARAQLIGFLLRAQDRGYRTVLVITGKGTGPPADPLAHALGEPQRGVLRRLVPQWLDSADLRHVVVSFTTAAIRHGGEGALYVQVRRRDRPPS